MQQILLHGLVVSVLSGLAHDVAAQRLEWPDFRGPHRDGVARRAKPPLTWSDTENLVWKLALPGPGSSSPIVDGDRVYVACYSGYGAHLDDGGDPKELSHHLVCVDRRTGKTVWDRSVPGPLEKPARQIQIQEHGFASPTPVTDGRTIYVYFGRAGVFAFDRDGDVIWQTDLGVPTEDMGPPTNSVERDGKTLLLRWGFAASPLLCDGLVIINASEESNSIRALDARTGELVWKRESPNLEGSAISPVAVGRDGSKVLVIALGGEVWGLEPRTGKLLWEVETGSRGGMVPTPVADDRCVYAFGGSGESHALRFAADLAPASEGEPAVSRVVWKGQNLGIPSPLLFEDRLFLVRTNGIGVCLEATDGKVVFNGRLPGRTSSIYASPLLADGRIYVVSRKRGTFVYSADGKFELLARNELADDGQFNASPAVVGNELFLRSDKHLYCFAESRAPR